MRRTYDDPLEKRTDFWIGFAGWFAINIAAAVLIQVVSNLSGPDLSGTLMGVLTATLIVVNLTATIVLAVRRGFAALGVVTAIATSLWVALIEGAFYVISLFAGGYTYYFRGNPPRGSVELTYAFLMTALIVGAIGAFPIVRAITKRIH